MANKEEHPEADNATDDEGEIKIDDEEPGTESEAGADLDLNLDEE